MASTSVSSIKQRFKYDVYLSFRGEDTRKGFVSHLYHALQQTGITTYKDDQGFERGERIHEQLIRAIEESRFYIILFSKNYAASSYCLDELVKIMECQRMEEHTAIPIFYDVEPTEVRNQSGAVGEAFARYENEKAAWRWRAAMTEAADLAGWKLNTFKGDEAKLIQSIVEDISVKLQFYNSIIDAKLVGMEPRVKSVVSSLEMDSVDVRMIGIKGIGGGGKTTLARAVFDHISVRFEGKSFVENVRNVSKKSGLKDLQKQVLSDVLNDPSIDVKSVSQGKILMKMKMSSRKVLVVLDDVDDIDQLEALAGETNWFNPGSRIIITTRDKHVLIAHGVKCIHDAELLSDEEAICLFSRYAFGKEIPNQEYEELSEEVVQYAAGLPITIKVLGSHLCGRSEHEWEDTIERLKTIPEEKTLKTLETSYTGLEFEHKEIFLDIACILKGEMAKKAIRILESCGFYADIGLRVLEQKSLITISNTGCLGLHDRLAEMGRHIVRRLHPHEPNKHSRLWIREEIEEILLNDLGTEATRSIKLLNRHLSPDIIMNGLTKMTNLIFLYVDNGYKTDVYASPSSYNCVSLPNALQYLYWHSYPLSTLPKNFGAYNLVNLEMPHSNISQLWEGKEKKVLNKLRFLDLSFSRLKTFDLGLTPHLESLDLRGCKDFAGIHIPIECPKLEFIHLSGCKLSNRKLGLTSHFERLIGLEELTLSIQDIVHLPDSICMLKHLTTLELKSCWLLEKLPKDLGRLEWLEKLYLLDCASLRDIPDSICYIRSLKYLHLPYCALVEKLPEKIGRLRYLEELNIEGTGIKDLPSSIYQLEDLCIVWSKARLKSCGFTSLINISKYTASCYISQNTDVHKKIITGI